MQIKIWGARGSIPAPLRPESVREKFVSAFLGISKIEDSELREKLTSALLETPEHSIEASEPGIYEKVLEKIHTNRRQAIESYLDSLSPLKAGTAGGNTPCIEIRSGNDLIIIDAGSGIRELGQTLMEGPWGKGEGVIYLFFSHPHWDHLQGFPFFRPAFVPGNKINIYSVHDIETALRRQQEAISFPVSLDYMQASMVFNRLEPGRTVEIGALTIRNIRNEHPGDAYGFRFEKGNRAFVYASDAAYPAGLDKNSHISFFDKADVLIFDAQFKQRESDEKEDWGHSSSFEGVEMAQQADVKKLVLFHYDPTYNDQELEEILDNTLKFQQNQYPNRPAVEIVVAQEGQVFDLTPEQTTQVQQVPGSKAAMLQPVGIFDERVAAELRDQLTEMTQTQMPPQLIIDMSQVELLQVAGLRALVKLRKEYQEQGVSTALVNPSISVQQLIELAGYLDFFAIYSSAREALKSLEARETLNLPGQMLKNRYRIEEKIGEGRLGTVFKAVDVQQNVPVAIKILSPSFSEGAIEQFIRQARQIIDLMHPNVVDVYDCIEDRGIAFMVEEFVESKTLQDILDQHAGQPLPFNLALSIAESMTRGLEYAHGNNVIHGDLKPKNVLLSENELKISDLGLGRLESGRPLVNIDVPLTLVTARYLAPEQVLGHPIDARTDLYALGVILYEMFTGKPLFEGTDQEVMKAHRDLLPTPPCDRNPNLSRSLEHLVLKLLDKDPNKRYANARQVRHILMSMLTTISGEVQTQAFAKEQWSALIGREAELSQLLELWSATEKGQGQVVLLNGDVGIGKTYLIQELTYCLDEATVLIGHCHRLRGSAPFYPFISAVHTYFENVPLENVDSSTGQFWREIAQIIPEISDIIPDIKPLLPENEGEVTIESANVESGVPQNMVAQALMRATAKRPWLLVLEDLQWADSMSLELLHYLAHQCHQMGLMIACLYDSDSINGNNKLEDMLDQLGQHCTTITLEPLAEQEVKALLEGVWLQLAPGNLVSAIYTRTQGNPLYVKEVARGLVDEGVISWRDNKWFFGPVVESGLPNRIQEAIQRRINRLSRETQTFLSQAAIFDPDIKFEDLHEMSDLSEWDALESLDITLQRQILQEVPGEKTLRFSHPKIQEVVYQGLSSLRQRLMHREAGEALERQYPSEPKRIAEVLAHHFFEAGEFEKGLIYSIQAATQAKDICAQQNAVYWYTRAVDVVGQLGIDALIQEQQFELLLAREEIYHYLGYRQLQLNDLAKLQELADSLKDKAKQAISHYRRARYTCVINDFDEAQAHVQAGLDMVDQTDGVLLESQLLTLLANINIQRGEFDQAEKHLNAIQSTLAASNGSKVQSEVLLGLGILSRQRNNFADCEHYHQQALEVSLAAGNRYGQVDALIGLGDTLLRKGEYDQATAYLKQALTISQFISFRPAEAACRNKLAALYTALGVYDSALRYVDQATTIYKDINNKRGLAEALLVWGGILLTIDEYEAAQEHIDEALEICNRLDDKILEADVWLHSGLVLEQQGELSKADQAYQKAQNVYESRDNKLGSLDAKIGRARCLFADNKTEEAQQAVKSFLEEPGLNGVWGMTYPVHFYLSAYRILSASDNAHHIAQEALEKGHILLQYRLNMIEDETLQASFLNNVPENKALFALLEGEFSEAAN